MTHLREDCSDKLVNCISLFPDDLNPTETYNSVLGMQRFTEYSDL